MQALDDFATTKISMPSSLDVNWGDIHVKDNIVIDKLAVKGKGK